MAQFHARYATNIQADIKRNWSSWNFGNEGIKGTYSKLESMIEELQENGGELAISCFNIWVDEETPVSFNYKEIIVDGYTIRELYENYWVVVDTINANGGISTIELKAETLEAAIAEVTGMMGGHNFSGDGVVMDTDCYDLVWSSPCNEYHIFEEC